jgi:hypothetical protein
MQCIAMHHFRFAFVVLLLLVEICAPIDAWVLLYSSKGMQLEVVAHTIVSESERARAADGNLSSATWPASAGGRAPAPPKGK